MSAAAKSMRLDRLLANLGYGSRRDIQSLVKRGRVVLDGSPLTDAGQHVAVSRELSERMTIAGARLDPPPGLVLMMHKPLGVTCSHKEAGPLIYHLLPQRWRARKPAISTIGRLDKDTSGLLLLTDDGALLHRAIAPKSKVAKRYLARLARPLRGDEAEVLASGTLMLEGEAKPLLPVEMEIATEAECGGLSKAEVDANGPVVVVTLMEGRYHQVRRMFAALGNHVGALHRDRFGGLQMPDDLAAGEFRVLDEAGIERIFA
ncbi:MAG: 16S rRNA pseudouridine(516) synthase [Alphaproteobacteria bacterium BRH_c36]|nr:MAG: 16S rRNA pseudouridine(516) synthase [Alphaproteobacteria bacterium BRH_c36]